MSAFFWQREATDGEARAGILAAATGNDTELLGFSKPGLGESEDWENGFWQEHA